MHMISQIEVQITVTCGKGLLVGTKMICSLLLRNTSPNSGLAKQLCFKNLAPWQIKKALFTLYGFAIYIAFDSGLLMQTMKQQHIL